MLFHLFQRADYWLHRQTVENRRFTRIGEWQSTSKNAESWGLKIRVSVVRFRDWPPKFQKPTAIGWFFFVYTRQYWRGFRARPRERHPSDICIFTLADASLFSVFSGDLASVREATSCIGEGLETVGCGWQLIGRRRLIKNLKNFSFRPRLCKNVQLLLCHSRVAFTIAIESL